MFDTIILTIVGFILVGAIHKIIRADEEHKRIDLSALIIVVLCLMILIQGKSYEKPNCDHAYIYEVAHNDGYEQAIKDAILWDADEYSYIISFNGELHTYANYYHED